MNLNYSVPVLCLQQDALIAVTQVDDAKPWPKGRLCIELSLRGHVCQGVKGTHDTR